MIVGRYKMGYQEAEDQAKRVILEWPEAEYPTRVSDEIRDAILEDRLKAERKAAREARRAARREAEWDLDGPPISPEAMPRLSGPAKPKRGRKAAAQA